MSGLAVSHHGQLAAVKGIGAAASSYVAHRLDEMPSRGFRAPASTGWMLPSLQGDAALVSKPSGHATRLAAPLNLEIVADFPFRAEGFFGEGRLGWVGHCEVPPSEMRVTSTGDCAAAQGSMSVWVIEEGRLALEHPGASLTDYGAGTVLLWRGMQPPRGRWDHARFCYVHLVVPGHRPNPGPGASDDLHAAQRLDHLGLAPFLAAQLRTFTNHAATLSAAELGDVVDGIVQVTQALLRATCAPNVVVPARPDVARLQAVHRYIEHNLHRNDLSVAEIARGTSMSRAQLYRAFETQEASVRGTLREKRLQKSLAYLAQGEGRRLSIGEISHACGFSDPAVFSKLFRQRFNASPREVRAAQGPAR